MSTFQEFKNLHEQNPPLYIGNVWDVGSAIMLENKHYKALGTSSAAIATSLGYEDGEEMGLENPLRETLSRANLYEAAGADGIFVPCITDEKDIKEIVKNTTRPLNVMTMPDLPSFQKLQELGVKRISSGPFIYNRVSEYFSGLLEAIDERQSFNPIFE